MSTIYELHEKLINQEISAVELTKEYLANIDRENEKLNTFITVSTDKALADAKEADALIASEDYSILTGIPYAAKDIFCTKGIKTTAGSKILESYVPPYDATVISKLKDAVLLGKTNCDEFAMGGSGENSAYGVTKNPFDIERVPGGSSSGSAAAVASQQAVFALGTDTGGSIRQPASFTNTVGLKVTYGRVSRYGVCAMASSFDTIGPITQDVRDAALVLQTIAGRDNFDGTTCDITVDEYIKEIEKSITKLRVGIPKEFLEMEGIDNQVKELFFQAVEKIKKMGVEIIEISLPHAKYAIPVYYILIPSEVSSNMARYDGIKYGYRADDAESLLDVYMQSRQQGFGREVKRRIMIGTYSLSSGYYDAYYKKASKVRTLICNDFKNNFKDVDCIISPTTPTPAFKINEKSDPLSLYMADIFTAPASCAGIPALSVPAGKVNNLPVGLQIMGNYFRESDILRLGRHFEQA
ncbi:MAG: Asp-tRNA(Asn)/Glu-tRNA(Gln) amidotransferase subunit GatA [Patescibacteria group bacterium]